MPIRLVALSLAILSVASRAGQASPTTREAILKDLKPPAGFDLTLFAAPPDVNHPTCLAATPRGEVFVGIDDQGSVGRDKGNSLVVRRVDTDGDRSAC